MRTTSTSISAVGSTAWQPINYRQSPFNVSVAVDFDSAASGITYTVEHTFDDPTDYKVIKSITRSTTTVTVTYDQPHDLQTNDSISVEQSGVSGMDGQFNVTVTGLTTLTYTSSVSGTATGQASVRVVNLRVFPHQFLAAKTTAGDSNYAYPVTMSRLTVTAYAAGKATMILNQGMNA